MAVVKAQVAISDYKIYGLIYGTIYQHIKYIYIYMYIYIDKACLNQEPSLLARLVGEETQARVKSFYQSLCWRCCCF